PLDDAGRAAIGADAKLVLALDLEEFRGLIEHGRDFCVLHRHGRKTHQAGLCCGTSYPAHSWHPETERLDADQVQQDGLFGTLAMALDLWRRRNLPAANWPSFLREGPQCGLT